MQRARFTQGREVVRLDVRNQCHQIRPEGSPLVCRTRRPSIAVDVVEIIVHHPGLAQLCAANEQDSAGGLVHRKPYAVSYSKCIHYTNFV
jgi:hypothetical protein